ncbi:MAG: amino acid transporter [Devosiaceae bacterium]|nr:amino acid transporter [Devosiaceae bacterium MH13]
MLAETFLKGFLLGAGLIIAIGAQNAFILALGLKRQHAMKAALVCAASDTLLIVLGVAGLGALIASNPTATTVAAVGGAAFLLGYAVLALKRAIAPKHLEAAQAPSAKWPVILSQTLAVTYLNPHVYLDTVVMLGAISAQIDQTVRPWFAVGAAAASFSWFIALAGGASLLAPYLARPVTWRIIDALTALVMIVIAWRLLAPYVP